MVPKPVQDAGYTAVGIGVLALQQFHLRRKAVKARIDSVLGEVRSAAEPLARRTGLPELAAPVCAAISEGKALIGAALRRPGPGS